MGHKSKSGQRSPSGRLSRAYRGPARDAGTPELQAKREALVGVDQDGKPNDPNLAGSALGCLLARGYIDRDQHGKGLEYGRLRCALFGPPWPSNTFGLEASEERIEELADRFKRMTGLLTAEQEHVVSGVCAFNAWPQWFFNESIGRKHLREDIVEKELLTAGLEALVAGKRRVRELTDACEIGYAHT